MNITKKVLNEPGKALNDFSMGVIEKYFILAFVVLFIFAGLSFWAGFIENQIFFQITFYFFLVLLFAVGVVFYKIKKGISYLAQRLDKGMKKIIKEKNSRVVDIEAEE